MQVPFLAGSMMVAPRLTRDGAIKGWLLPRICRALENDRLDLREELEKVK